MINLFKLFQRKMTSKRLYRKMQNTDVGIKITMASGYDGGYAVDFKLSTGESVHTYWSVEFITGIVTINGIEEYSSSDLTKKIQALAKYKSV